jgi:hypothetical protein
LRRHELYPPNQIFPMIRQMLAARLFGRCLDLGQLERTR